MLLARILVTSLPAVIWSQTPTPLVEMRFDGHLLNTGSLGGEGKRVEYASGQGPTHTLGVRGLGISFEASSRAGGNDTKLAGGAIVLDAPSIAALDRFTVCLWITPVDPTGPARILYVPGRWDLYTANLRLIFKVNAGGKDFSFPVSLQAPALAQDQWNFVALSVDLVGGSAILYHALLGSSVSEVARWEGIPQPDPARGALQIGNLEGIRPFRGRMDNLRVFGTILSAGEVRRVYEADLPPKRTLKDYVMPLPTDRIPSFRHSDVFFSTRWVRPESLSLMAAFRANHVVWVYTEDASFVKAVHDAGSTLQATINSIPRTGDLSAYCVDLNGTRLVAPWMAGFGKDPPKWGCNNQPAFRTAVLERARKALDAGADWLQFDDWALIASAHAWGGGCMCDRCMEAFRAYLAKLSGERLSELGIYNLEEFDYRRFLADKYGIRDAAAYNQRRHELPTTQYFEDFQRRSVREYFIELRHALDSYAGRPVPLSINANLCRPSQQQNFLADIVDFFLGETSSTTLPDLAVCAATADALGKPQIISPFPYNVNDARLALAATYALGQFYLVPWDVWMGPDKPRHFGTVEEYGDLYHFVRDHADLFDQYEAPGVVGVIVDMDHYDHSATYAAVKKLLRARVPFAFVLVGHEYFDLPLEPARLRKFDALIRLSEPETYSEEDREALAQVAREVPVISLQHATEALLLSMAPIDVWAPDELYVFPRVSPDQSDQTLVFHVLNRHQAGENRKVVPLRHVSFGLRSKAMLRPKLKRALWYAPGRESQEIEIDFLPQGPRLIIPEVAEWGIVRVEFIE
jgi:hypothetical protein